MGQESSTPLPDNVPTQTLKSRDVPSVAEYIKSGRAKRIVVMTGAGISTSAGIPDFRSPTTGLYSQLARLNLPHPEAVFDISYFRQNPQPFYTLARELYPGTFRPTLTHSFVRLLSDKGLLLKLFTQNIDCLERQAGVPPEKIVEAHGSFARQSCIDCKAAFPQDVMEKIVLGERAPGEQVQVPRCVRESCGGLVKPEIVFFGEQLPQDFSLNRMLPAAADLCIVMGTSLSVQPFASLPGFCGEGVPRVLINLERVGGLGSRTDDVLILESCDAGVRKLAAELGWLEELEALWAKTKPDKHKAEGEAAEGAGAQARARSRSEVLAAEVEKLTKDVEQTLLDSGEHEAATRKLLQDEVDVKKDAKGESTAHLRRDAGEVGNDGGIADELAGLKIEDKARGSEDSLPRS